MGTTRFASHTYEMAKVWHTLRGRPVRFVGVDILELMSDLLPMSLPASGKYMGTTRFASHNYFEGK